jgi:hypothetical protein
MEGSNVLVSAVLSRPHSHSFTTQHKYAAVSDVGAKAFHFIRTNVDDRADLDSYY